jgi:hypothetical protein
VSLFFKRGKERVISAEEAAQFDLETSAEIVERLRAITTRALSELPEEFRDWLGERMPDTNPPEWFDPGYPHLLYGEAMRLYFSFPSSKPDWIALNQVQSNAWEILVSARRAVHMMKDLPDEQALRLLSAGVNLGEALAMAHAQPWEKSAEYGKATGVNQQERARQPRPSTLSPLKAKVLALMFRYKQDDTLFSTFMEAWRMEPLDGLRIERIGMAEREQEQKYLITDENSDGIEPSKPYAYKTLKDNLWERCNKKPQ